MPNQGLTEEQKNAINNTIKQMVEDGASEEEILAYKDSALSEVKSSTVQDQPDAPAQDLPSGEQVSASEPSSSDFQLQDDQKAHINNGIRSLVSKGATEAEILAFKNLQLQKFQSGEETPEVDEELTPEEQIYNDYNSFVKPNEEEMSEIRTDYIAKKESEYEALSGLSEEEQKKTLGSKAEWDRYKRFEKDGEVIPTDMDLSEDVLAKRQLKSNRFLQDLPSSDRESVLGHISEVDKETEGKLGTLGYVIGEKDKELESSMKDFNLLKTSLEAAHKKGQQLTPEVMQQYEESRKELLVKVAERNSLYGEFMEANEDQMDANLAIDAFKRNYSGFSNLIQKEGPKAVAKLGFGLIEMIVGKPGERGKAEEDWTPVEQAIFGLQDYVGRNDPDSGTNMAKESLLDAVAYYNEQSQEYSPYHISAADISSVDDFVGYAEQTAVENTMPIVLAVAAGPAAPAVMFEMGHSEKKVEYALAEREAKEELPGLIKQLETATGDEAVFLKEKIKQYQDTLSRSESDKELAAISYGAAEAVFESLTTLKLIKNLQKPLKYIPKSAVRQGVKRNLLKRAAYHGQAPLMEVAGESMTTIAQNLTDIAIDGSDKSILEGIEDAALSALLIGGGFKAVDVSKGAYGAAVNASRNRAEKAKITENATRIDQINRELSSNPDLSDADRALLAKDRKKLFSEVTSIADGAVDRLDYMKLDEIKELFDYEKQLRGINQDLINVENSEALSEKIKERYRTDLQTAFNEKLVEREDFLSKFEENKEEDLIDRESELNPEDLEKLQKIMGVKSSPEVIQTKEEILEQDVNDNQEASNNLYQSSYDKYGVEILPAQGSARASMVNARVPMTKDGDKFTKGDFVKNITSGTLTKEEAAEAKKDITNKAKAAGFVPKVRVLKNGDGGYELSGTIEAAKRGKSLTNAAVSEVKEQELAQEEKETKTPKVIVTEGNRKTEARIVKGAEKLAKTANKIQVADQLRELRKQHREAVATKGQLEVDRLEEQVEIAKGALEILTGKKRKTLDEKAAEENVRRERKPVEAAIDYAQSEAKDQGGIAYEGDTPVAKGDGSVLYPGLSDTKQFKTAGIYATIGRLKKAGYPEARYEITDEGAVVIPGEIDLETKRDELQIKPEAASPAIDRLKKADVAAEDGATFNLDGTEYEGGGLVVPIASKNVKVSELSPEAIQKYVDENQARIGDAGIVKAGIYKFPNSDNASIDLNIVVPSKNREAALEVGKYLGQESLFDLDTFENVKTGESGQNTRELTDKQFKDTAGALAKGFAPSFISGKALPIDADALNYHDSPLQGAPEDGPQRDDFQVKDTPKKKGELTPSDLKDLGINESDIFNKAAEGQIYVKENFDKKGAVVDLDKSIGGKGGFASTGDAREAISTLGRPMSIRDGMRLTESIYASQKSLKDLFGPDAIKVSEAGSEIMSFSKIRYEASGKPLSESDMNRIRAEYDKLAGYKDAHKNLDNDFKIVTANALNVDVAGKKDPHAAPPPGARRDDQDLIAVTDRAGQISKTKGIYAYLSRLSGYKPVDANILLGSQAKAKESAVESSDASYNDLTNAYNRINAAVKAAVAMRGDAPISKQHSNLVDAIKGLRPLINMNNAILDHQAKIDILENKIDVDPKAIAAASAKMNQVARGLNEALNNPDTKQFIREGLGLDLPNTGFVPDDVFFREEIEGPSKSTEKSIAKERGVTLGNFTRKLEKKDIKTSLNQKDLATLFELLNNFTVRIANKKFDARQDPDVISAARLASFEAIQNITDKTTVDDLLSDAYNRVRDNVRAAKREGASGRFISLPHNLAVKDRMFSKATSKLEEKGWTPTDQEIADEINRVNKKQSWTDEDVYEHRLLVHEAKNTFFEGSMPAVQNTDNTLTYFSLDNLTGTRKLAVRFNSLSESIFGKEKLAEIDEEVIDILGDPDIIEDPQDANQQQRRETEAQINKANRAKTELISQLILDELRFEDIASNREFLSSISDLIIKRKDPRPKTDKAPGTTRAVEKIDLWDEVFSPEAKRRNPNGPRLWTKKIANLLAEAAEYRALKENYGSNVYEPGQAPIDEYQFVSASPLYGAKNAKRPFSIKKNHNPGRSIGEVWNAEKPASLVGKEFVEVITGENPESLRILKGLASREGWFVHTHPQNVGEVIITPKGTKLYDVAYFGATSRGMAFQEDPRRYTDKGERRGDNFVYPNLNRDRFSRTLDHAIRKSGDRYWSEFTRIDQLDPADQKWIEDQLAERGITRENGKLKVENTKGTHPGAIEKTRFRIANNPISELSYYENKAISKNTEAVGLIIDYLSKKFKGNINFAYSKKAVQERVDILNAQRRAKGLSEISIDQFAGVRTFEGDIVINPEVAGLDAPFHEVGHSWLKAFSDKYSSIYAKAESLAKKSDLYESLRNNEVYRTYSEAQYLEEVMAQLIGEAGVNSFKNKLDGTRWQNFVSKVKAFAANILGLSPSAIDRMTLEDFVNFAATDIIEGGQISNVFTDEFQTSPDKVDKPAESKLEDETLDDSSDRLHAKEGRAERIKRFFKNPIASLIPPAADDYHGLVSKLRGLVPSGKVEEVTDTFIKNHHAYVDASQQARKAVKDNIASLEKALGHKIDKDVLSYKGNRLSAAQAIQAIVDGHTGQSLDAFAKKKAVEQYIEDMMGRGILKPSKSGSGYDTASPEADKVNFIANDLYKSHFAEFKAKKSEVYSPTVMSKIRRDKGTKYHDSLKKALDKMTTGKAEAEIIGDTTRKWNNFMLGSVGVTMFINLRSAALQMLSVLNYGFNSKRPGVFLAKFASPSTFARAKELFNDPYLKERRARAGFDVNAAEMMDLLNKSETFADFTKKVLNFGFKATSLVDSMAISLGGAAFIEAQMSAGVSEADAKKQWKEATEEAQQSSRPDRTSKWQTDSVSKFVLAFANTPAQYFRLGQKASRTFRDPKATTQQRVAAIARIGWYMGVQNAIFTMMQSASTALLMGDDEEKRNEQLGSIADSFLRGMGLYGAIASSVFQTVKELKGQVSTGKYDELKVVSKALSISPPLKRKMGDIAAIARAYKYDDEQKHAIAVSRTGSFVNLPTDWGLKKFNAVHDIWSEQYTDWQKFLRVLGYSRWQFEKNESKDYDIFKSLNFDDLDLNSVEIDGLEDLDYLFDDDQ